MYLKQQILYYFLTKSKDSEELIYYDVCINTIQNSK